MVHVLAYISLSVMKVMFSEQGLGAWNKLWILNLTNKSVHTLFSFWEICWEWGGMKARKEDVELEGSHRWCQITHQNNFLRLSCCWHLFPAVLCEIWKGLRGCWGMLGVSGEQAELDFRLDFRMCVTGQDAFMQSWGSGAQWFRFSSSKQKVLLVEVNFSSLWLWEHEESPTKLRWLMFCCRE